MDFYLSEENCIDRLIKEWRKYGKIVIAVDFDNTIFDCHNEGKTYDYVINLLKRCKKIGCYIIVFTANDDPERHKFIREYYKNLDIEIDTINDNVPAVPYTTKKPYYNVLLDDRAGLPSAYCQLLHAVEHMECGE